MSMRRLVLIALLVGCGPAVSEPDDSGGAGSRGDDADDDDDGAEGARDGGADDRGGADGEDKPDDGGGKEDEGGRDDPKGGEGIRACFECWKQTPEACERPVAECWDSLACTQLMDCPAACEFSPDCVAECNEIIPSGVETLTAAVQCMVCDDGPCAADCGNDWIQSYCG